LLLSQQLILRRQSLSGAIAITDVCGGLDVESIRH
jgi:hypothetical protein